MKKLLLGILATAITLQLSAQEENAKKITGLSKNYSLFYGGIETSTTAYINTDTKDSTGVQLYIAPYLDYYHKSGFGARVKTYVLPGGSNPGFYLTSFTPYFARYTGKVFPYVSYTRYVQHDNPSVPYSAIQNDVYAHLRIRTKYIDPMAGINIGFGNDKQNNNKSVSDVNAFAALVHLFVKENLGKSKNNAVAVMPSLQLNAGTDRYFKFLRTTNYISQNTKLNRVGYGRGRGNGGNQQGGLPVEEYTISEENEFALSNVEVNLYAMYFFGKFSIEPSGSLYFPLRGDDKTPYGYWQVNLNYWIR